MPIDPNRRRTAAQGRGEAAGLAPVETSSSLPAAAPRRGVGGPAASPPGFDANSDYGEANRGARTAEGRRKRGGTDDDSIGRRKRGGTDDDSIGFGNVVLDSLVGPDNDPSRLALRDALYARLETPSYLRAEPAEPAAALPPGDLRQIASLLPAVLPGSQGVRLLASARSELEVAARLDATLQRTSRLPPDLRSSLLQTFALDPEHVNGAVVTAVTGSEAFASASAPDQKKLATVMSRLDATGLKAFGALIEQNPGALASTDSHGKTLLDNLNQLATQPLNAKLVGQATTEAILSSALVETVNPNRIEQGTAPTCTVASMQYELVADDPSEYVRLLAGLTGLAGKSKMRAGGDLKLGPEDVSAEARGGRTISQALFQSAAMEYANGRLSQFDSVHGRSRNQLTGTTYAGLKPRQQTTILRQLFGVRYTNDTLYTEGEGARALERLRGFDALGQRNRPVILEIDQGPSNHAVTLERVAEGRVFFRDPYGVLRSMPENLFPKYVVAIHQPAFEPAHVEP